ncbi:hypothetical protein C9J21_19880 [Photobacterium phosphoreum]|uniref:hypothetical protein n=1 Tax=Photobacterium phosphoreum TaxID=659 RepID=UPI000D156CF3|nr:hypothetical protein [Photobacterium phosphoreum]PSW29148.1 hypothetical protein C9J21_19880 [Photobacterium phosphoreum]
MAHSINIYNFITANCYAEKGKLIPCFLISRRYTKTTKLFKISESGIQAAIGTAINWYFNEHQHKDKSKYLALCRNPAVEAHYADLIAKKISSSIKEVKFSTSYLVNDQPMYIKVNDRNKVHGEYSLNLHIKKTRDNISIRLSKIVHKVDDYFETLTSYIAIVTNVVMNNEINPFYANHLYIQAKYTWFNEMVVNKAFIESKSATLRTHYDHYWFYNTINKKLEQLMGGCRYKDLMPTRKRQAT